MLDPIEITVVLKMTPAKAFDVFVSDLDRWWPKAAFSLGEGLVMVPNAAGADITETLDDGTVHVWGHVITYEPPTRLAMTWHPGRDPAEATHIDIVFAPTDDGRTGVTLVHSGWDVLGTAALERRENYASGWGVVLGENFARYAGRISG